MSVAHVLSKAPWSAVEEVVNAFGQHGDQHKHVTDRQVHDQHVRWCTQSRRVTENVNHAVVTEGSDDGCA